jgi:outer membrane immunogenic protein
MSRIARVILLSTAATGFDLSAMAADLPNHIEPVASVAYVPAFSWTGFYVGGELGWTQTDREFTTGTLLLGAPLVVTSESNKNGLIYGILVAIITKWAS